MLDFFIFNNDKKKIRSIQKKIKKEYKTFKKGYIIYGAPCIGKTHWISNQKGKKKSWIDGDKYLLDINAINVNIWRSPDIKSDNYKLQYMRADYGQYMGKCYGLRIISSNYYKLLPDAIVIIDKKKHNEYIKKRSPTKKSINNIHFINKTLTNMAKKHKIPKFNSIEDAVKYLENK